MMLVGAGAAPVSLSAVAAETKQEGEGRRDGILRETLI